MSATITTIPMSTIVDVVPSVLSGGGSALDLLGLALDNVTNRVPIGSILSFPTLASVQSYAGPTSVLAAHAAVYFGGFKNATKLPGALLVTQYNAAAVGAYMRGGNISGLTLAQLQALTGVLTVSLDGTPVTSSAINLSSATSFSSAAQLITTALGTTGPTQATVTASTGCTFTGNASGTTLTVSAITGVLHPGDTVAGTGIPGATTIVAQLTGTTGSNGTYQTSVSTTASAASCTGTSRYLEVTVASGTIAIGQQVVGTGISASTFITAFGTGTGGTGNYITTVTQQHASESMTLVMPTVQYDSVSGAFVVTSSTTGAASTIGFATGTISAALLLTQATGAVLSQGAIPATPTAFMASVIAQTQDWATFWTLANPDASGNANKLLFAQWVNTTDKRFAYAVTDTDITATQGTNQTATLGNIIKTGQYDGSIVIYQPSEMYLGAFAASYGATLDFERHNGRTTLAFRTQAGLATSVTNATAAANLLANGYNFTGDYATANDEFNWFYNGGISGEFQWADSYINQIQLNNALQLALASLLDSVGSIPYNAAGYGLIRQAILDPVNSAINFGTIRAGVPLSAQQAAIVNNAVGFAVDSTLSSTGWYLDIKAATSIVRQARTSPSMALWYMDGESVQQITLASILIQ